MPRLLTGILLLSVMLRLHFCRAFSAASSRLVDPPLRVWHNAVDKVPHESVICRDMNGQKFAAFVGDKLLGASFAKWIQRQQSIKATFTHGRAAQLGALVLSNKFMAERVAQILPHPVYQDWATKELNHHSVGTLVEAAVATVQDPAAVDDLVEWLITEADDDDNDIFNAKGTLIELDGTVTVERQGGDDHDPRFLAHAVFAAADIRTQATGTSKKEAEQRAASECLAQMGYKEEIVTGDLVTSEPPDYNAWKQFGFEGGWDMRLMNNETMVEWWQRSARDPKKAFRRCLFCPNIFPDSIRSVDSWTRHYLCEQNETGNAESAVVVSIVIISKETSGDDGGSSSSSSITPTVTTWSTSQIAPSATKARSLAGLLANAEISRITGVDYE